MESPEFLVTAGGLLKNLREETLLNILLMLFFPRYRIKIRYPFSLNLSILTHNDISEEPSKFRKKFREEFIY